MKIYDLVKRILQNNPQARNSDKECIWSVYEHLGIVRSVHHFGERQAILKENFLSAKTIPFETITRARRKVQQLHPDLGATQKVVIRRRKKQKSGGNFIFHEELLGNPTAVI